MRGSGEIERNQVNRFLPAECDHSLGGFCKEVVKFAEKRGIVRFVK